MSTLNEIITFELESEHDFEHELENNLTQKSQFYTPKIYNAKGDLNKLLEKSNYRYNLIKNYPPQPNGTFAYFDLQTNELVFLDGLN